MADTTTDNRTEATEADADALASAVDALIDEIEGVCEAFDKSRADDAPAPPEADAPKPKAPARAPEAAPPADESLDAAVDALVAESVGAEAEAPPDASDADEPVAAPEAHAEPAPSGSIDELDAELAAAADEELDGDFSTMDDLEGEAVSPESIATAPEAQPEPEPVSEPDPEPVAARAPAPVEPAHSPEPAPAEEAPAPEPKPARRSWVAPVLRVLAAPLSRLTPMQRDTLGWVALNTLFLAACVWVFVLLR